ncbi:unnamed protein product [Symbiodinium sp. CCMP2592]|nr:unnamed protein product [Symbiodinium sp. CCMP2592]
MAVLRKPAAATRSSSSKPNGAEVAVTKVKNVKNMIGKKKTQLSKDNGGSGKAKKRPAAASLQESVNNVKMGSMETEHIFDDDAASGAAGEDGGRKDAKRDKGKAEKFKAMKLAGSLPPYVLDLYDKEADKKESPRAFRTTIINSLFKRCKSGRYSLVDNSPLFTEAKRVFEKKFGVDLKEAYPPLVMRGLFFNNSQAAMDRAMTAGQIQEIKTEEGTVMYTFRKVATGTERGCETDLGYKKQRRGTPQQAAQLEDLFNTLEWSVDFKTVDPSKIQPDDFAPRDLDSGHHPPFEREHEAAEEDSNEWNNEWKNLKACYMHAQKILSDLRHVMSFKEMPGGETICKQSFEQFIKVVAQKTLSHNEAVNAGKALAKTAKAVV